MCSTCCNWNNQQYLKLEFRIHICFSVCFVTLNMVTSAYSIMHNNHCIILNVLLILELWINVHKAWSTLWVFSRQGLSDAGSCCETFLVTLMVKCFIICFSPKTLWIITSIISSVREAGLNISKCFHSVSLFQILLSIICWHYFIVSMYTKIGRHAGEGLYYWVAALLSKKAYWEGCCL